MAPTVGGGGLALLTFLVLEMLQRNRKMRTGDADAKTDALRFEPHADRARLYVYREGFLARAAGLDVLVDESFVAQLTSPQFTVVTLDPGAHTVRVGFPKSAINPKAPTWTHDIDVRAGDVTALRLTSKMGMKETSIEMTVVPDLAKAQAGCRRGKMVLAEAFT